MRRGELRTPASGMCASFSPKCSMIGTRGLQVFQAEDAAAVIADRRSEPVSLGRGEPGERAAQAIADDADLAARLGRRDRRGDVEHS